MNEEQPNPAGRSELPRPNGELTNDETRAVRAILGAFAADLPREMSARDLQRDVALRIKLGELEGDSRRGMNTAMQRWGIEKQIKALENPHNIAKALGALCLVGGAAYFGSQAYGGYVDIQQLPGLLNHIMQSLVNLDPSRIDAGKFVPQVNITGTVADLLAGKNPIHFTPPDVKGAFDPMVSKYQEGMRMATDAFNNKVSDLVIHGRNAMGGLAVSALGAFNIPLKAARAASLLSSGAGRSLEVTARVLQRNKADIDK